MITDAEIDLTVDRKFGRNNIGSSRRAIPIIQHWGRPDVPWTTRSEMPKGKRSYSDPMSDNFGVTIRRTSDNKWFIVGDNSYKFFDLVFEEFVYEELGGLPGHVVMRCIRCGKLFLCKPFSRFECDDCIYEQKSEINSKLKKRTYQQIPWDHSRVFTEWRDTCVKHLNEIRQKVITYSTNKKINDIESKIMSLEDTNV